MIYQKKQIGSTCHKPACQVVSKLFFCDRWNKYWKKLYDLRVSVVNAYTSFNGENCCSEGNTKFNPIPQSIKRQHVLSHFAIVKKTNNRPPKNRIHELTLVRCKKQWFFISKEWWNDGVQEVRLLLVSSIIPSFQLSIIPLNKYIILPLTSKTC